MFHTASSTMSDWSSETTTKDSHTAEMGGVQSSDEGELERLGYKQELRRELSLFQNFGVSFSLISVVTGGTCLLPFGLTTGGPAVMVWGWAIVAFFTLLVALAMAEICSAYPTSGGPAYWSARMIPNPRIARITSWVTGWFGILGQLAVITGVSLACADYIATMASISTNYQRSPHKTFGIYAAILLAQGTINTFGIRVLKHLSVISVWWNFLGTIFVIISILVAAPKHQSSEFVFQTFIDGTGVDDAVGWSQRASPAYVALIGMLMAQWTLTGFDASAHMAEETRDAAVTGPIGIVLSISVSAILGWILMLGLLFSIQDYDKTVSSPTGQPLTQIFLDTVGQRGAIVLMVVVTGAMFFCGTFAVTSNSRMMYAFSRDVDIPSSQFFHNVDKRWHCPIRTVWLACALSFCLGLISLGSPVALNAATSITTIGVYTSFGIPIALRVIYADRFVPGPFRLGRFSHLIATTAALWIGFITVVFSLPELNPVNLQTLNYAPIAAGIVLVFALLFWVVCAHAWFTGPTQTPEEETDIVVVKAVSMSEKPKFFAIITSP